MKLYAEHDRRALLPFLKSSEKYNISRALQICQDKGLIEEVSGFIFRIELRGEEWLLQIGIV